MTKAEFYDKWHKYLAMPLVDFTDIKTAFATALHEALCDINDPADNEPCPHCKSFAEMKLKFNLTDKKEPECSELTPATHCCFCGRKVVRE
jgi:hypothetical protein